MKLFRSCRTVPDAAMWQRRVAAALADVLATREDLPPIAWSVGPGNSVLFGLIALTEDRNRYDVERLFAEWQASLGLTLLDPLPDVLRADHTRRDGVRILLIGQLAGELPRKDLMP